MEQIGLLLMILLLGIPIAIVFILLFTKQRHMFSFEEFCKEYDYALREYDLEFRNDVYTIYLDHYSNFSERYFDIEKVINNLDNIS